MIGRLQRALVSQERIVLAPAVVLFCVFSLYLRGFLNAGNLITLVRSVSTLGVLGVAMAIVVIGQGVDLAIVATYAMSAAWTLRLASQGVAIGPALGLGLALAVAIGLVNGVLIAYAEIPALFATLGMAAFVYGFVRFALAPLVVVYLPASAAPILFFALVALLGRAFLSFTKAGRFIYAMGDNFAAARNSGASVRRLIVLQYAISAAIAYVASVITATAVSSVNTNVVNSSLIYDVILVVVLGGVGLSGSRGGI